MKRLKNMTAKQKIYAGAGCILLAWLGVFSFVNGSCQSLWVDELSSVGVLMPGVSLGEMMENYMTVESNLPLYSLILYAFYRLAPFGEQFLLVPSILFCIAGAVLLASAVGKLAGENAGFIVLCLTAASNALIWQCAFEARCYGLVFCASSAVLYTYVKKTFEPCAKNEIWFGAAVFVLVWSHWFGCLLVAFYGVTELILIMLRKRKWRELLAYLPGGLSILPWTVMFIFNQQEIINDFWGAVPQLKNMAWTVLFLLGGRRLLWYVCLVAGAAAVLLAVKRTIYKKNPGVNSDDKEKRELLRAHSTLAIVWVIAIVFLYSRYINPKGSLYVERYFVVIMPHVFLVTACGLNALLASGLRLSQRLTGVKGCGGLSRAVRIGTAASIGLFLFGELLLCYRDSYLSIRKPWEDYRSAAQYMVKQGDIWDEDVLFAGSNRYFALDGFLEYYFRKQGYPEPVNVMDGHSGLPGESRFYSNYLEYGEEGILKYDRIYFLSIHMSMDEPLQELVEKHYELEGDGVDTGVQVWRKKNS